MAFKFAQISTKRIEIGDGDWILIKEELSAGEQRQLQAAGLGGMTRSEGGAGDDMTIGVDWAKFSLARTLAFVTDWNAKDEQGNPVPFNEDTVRALDSDSLTRIETAISTHIEARDAAKKKADTKS